LRIDVRKPQGFVVVRQYAHAITGFELLERGLLRVDLVAEDPQMSGVQAAVFIAFQPQRRQLGRGLYIGHGRHFVYIEAHSN